MKNQQNANIKRIEERRKKVELLTKEVTLLVSESRQQLTAIRADIEGFTDELTTSVGLGASVGTLAALAGVAPPAAAATGTVIAVITLADDLAEMAIPDTKLGVINDTFEFFNRDIGKRIKKDPERVSEGIGNYIKDLSNKILTDPHLQPQHIVAILEQIITLGKYFQAASMELNNLGQEQPVSSHSSPKRTTRTSESKEFIFPNELPTTTPQSLFGGVELGKPKLSKVPTTQPEQSAKQAKETLIELTALNESFHNSFNAGMQAVGQSINQSIGGMFRNVFVGYKSIFPNYCLINL